MLSPLGGGVVVPPGGGVVPPGGGVVHDVCHLPFFQIVLHRVPGRGSPPVEVVEVPLGGSNPPVDVPPVSPPGGGGSPPVEVVEVPANPLVELGPPVVVPPPDGGGSPPIANALLPLVNIPRSVGPPVEFVEPDGGWKLPTMSLIPFTGPLWLKLPPKFCEAFAKLSSACGGGGGEVPVPPCDPL